MYVIVLLIFQLIFGIEIYGKYIDDRLLYLGGRPIDVQLRESQEPWRIKLEKDINDFDNEITRFTNDWKSFDKIKDQLIESNKINFEIIWTDWPESYDNNDNLENCDSVTYRYWVRNAIENQYKILQTIIVKPLDMYKNYTADILQYLNIQITILKEFIQFKLNNCDTKILNCTEDRKRVSYEFERNRIALKNLEENTANIFELLRNVSYNMYKQKYTTTKELYKTKNKYACCSSGKTTCMNVSTEMDQFEPLNFESLMPKYNFQSQSQDADENEEENIENSSQDYYGANI